ncbi:MAG: B12-binding domain-containing radical SAM protein, partial [Planctomycetota bacterium]
MSDNNLNSKNLSKDADRLDLLLINPSLDWQYQRQRKIAVRIEDHLPSQETPHIGIAYLLAVAKKAGYRTKYIDMVMDAFSVEELLQYVAKTKPSLIGITAFAVQISAASTIAGKIKQQMAEALICVGGSHASAIPEQTLEEFPDFDFVVCGEAENLLPKIFDCLGNYDALSRLSGIVTKDKKDHTWVPIQNIEDIPLPAWEEFDLTKYPGNCPHRTRQELPVVTGRGCPFRCVFCCRALGSKVRRRSVESVISEIERNIEEFGCESIAFLDETFVLSKDWAEQFFSQLIYRGLNKKINWSCSMRVSNVSPELFQRMKEAGCYYIFFGIESASDATLKRIKKGITLPQIRNAVKWTKQAGITPIGAFIIGLPGDSEADILKSVELAKELDMYSNTFPIAIPFPGTEMREMALKNMYGMKILS